jgi:hypothetical protein
MALRRRPPNGDDADPLCDKVYFGTGEDDRKEALHRVMRESDYVLCAAPLSPETENIFDKNWIMCWSVHIIGMYQQEILQDEADFVVDENLPRFLREEELLNPVDKGAGYWHFINAVQCTE